MALSNSDSFFGPKHPFNSDPFFSKSPTMSTTASQPRPISTDTDSVTVIHCCGCCSVGDKRNHMLLDSLLWV